MLKTITELTIKRSTWLRGEGWMESYLLRQKDGKMCCLGSFCLAVGLTDKNICDEKEPGYLDSGFNVPQLVDNHGDSNKITMKLMATNDDKAISDTERENQIAALMLQLNPPVKVTFVD